MVFLSTLRPVWKSAHGFKNISLEDINFRKICDDLDTFVCSSFIGGPRWPATQDPSATLGLSSLVLNGAARLWCLEANRLLDDCNDLFMAMVCPKTGRSSRNQIDESSESLLEMENESGPSRNSNNSGNSDSSTSCLRKRTSSGSDQSQKRARYSQNSQPTTSVTTDETSMFEGSASSSASSILDNSATSPGVSSPLKSGTPSDSMAGEQRNDTPTAKNTVDVGVQTKKSYLSRRQRHSNNSPGFDEDLPFGYITVFDNIHDKLPSRVILSSLNASVRNL